MNSLMKLMNGIGDWEDFELAFKSPLFTAVRPKSGSKIEKTEGGVRILVPLPGVTTDQVDVTVKDGILNVATSVSEESDAARFTACQSHSWRLTGYDEDEVKAVMKDGLLTIELVALGKQLPEGRRVKVLEG